VQVSDLHGAGWLPAARGPRSVGTGFSIAFSTIGQSGLWPGHASLRRHEMMAAPRTEEVTLGQQDRFPVDQSICSLRERPRER